MQAQKKKILVIDDNNLHAHRLEMSLKEGALEVKVATDPVDGLSLLRSFKPDIIVTEWNMKTMNGGDFYREVRKVFESVPMIIYSNFPLENIAPEIRHNGSVSYVSKDDGGIPLLKEEIQQVQQALED